MSELVIDGSKYFYYNITEADARVMYLPYTIKIIFENVLRQRAEAKGRAGDIEKILAWPNRRTDSEIRFCPSRVMMDDTAGIPLVGDLAAMRDAVLCLGGNPQCVSPMLPVDFIIDHSVIADHVGSPDALRRNVALEYSRNSERYAFLRWGGKAFENIKIVPPGKGICHQINLEYLARVVDTRSEAGRTIAYPDTMVGIDSHTPMVNGMGVVGWGVSGMEGLAVALGEPIALRIPDVVGCRLAGKLSPGVTATDLVLSLVEMLRRYGVVGKVIEYFGHGLRSLSVPDRATVANMTPETGATMSYFPIDGETIAYLRVTGRDAAHVALVESYAKAQGLWADYGNSIVEYSETLEVDLSKIEASISGPSQPHRRVSLQNASETFRAACPATEQAMLRKSDELLDGDIVIAAITSCTNTSNPAAMVAAGLVARNAAARGLKVKPWVKTSLSPGSRVVAAYLEKTGLQKWLDTLGFHVAGYGCMTCVGFSGSLAASIESIIATHNVYATAVLSGNRNYDGRIHPSVQASFLASPPLVIAYAIAGSMLVDLTRAPLTIDEEGRPIYLSDLWPDDSEVREIISSAVEADLYTTSYRNLYEGDIEWQNLKHQCGVLFEWNKSSSIIRPPQLFDDIRLQPDPVSGICSARILAMYGDLVTTEHVSPMGPIPRDSFAGKYLLSIGVRPNHLGSFAARRLNDDVMTRSTFASVHLRNEMTPGLPGGGTIHLPDGEHMSIFDAARSYRRDNVPLVVVAGHGYGTGSSRDWAAKGPSRLGVRAIIAESFERIHRANLAAAGVLPLQFANGQTRRTLQLDGTELLDLLGMDGKVEPGQKIVCSILRMNGRRDVYELTVRLETSKEIEYFHHGGALRYLIRRCCNESL